MARGMTCKRPRPTRPSSADAALAHHRVGLDGTRSSIVFDFFRIFVRWATARMAVSMPPRSCRKAASLPAAPTASAIQTETLLLACNPQVCSNTPHCSEE